MEETTMAQPNEPYVEKTVVEQPTIIRREEVRVERSSSAGWWIAALVAIIAVVGLFFVFNSGTTREGELQAARESGRSQAMLDNATTQAQTAAAAASAASRDAADSVAMATRSAADNASAAAERTAEAGRAAAANAGEVGEDASTTAPLR